jgi:hypothetical protein
MFYGFKWGSVFPGHFDNSVDIFAGIFQSKLNLYMKGNKNTAGILIAPAF